MKRTSHITKTAAASLWILTLSPVPGQSPASQAPNAAITDGIIPGADGRASAAVARGHAAFNQRNLHQLGGNGRSCADCHMPTENFQLSPAAARARLDTLLERRLEDPGADDPLFRPVDADDFRTNGEDASDYSNLVENGLVRVTMRLPLNVKLLAPVTDQPMEQDFVDLWRAVPSVLDVAITGPDGVLPIHPPPVPVRGAIMGQDPFGPNRQGGYQIDARFGTLQEQARAALIAHAQISVEPPQRMLDDLAVFQQTLFSSRGVESLASEILTGTTVFSDPDPELNDLEIQGKIVFNRACAQCHGSTLHPGTSTPEAGPTFLRPIRRYHNILATFPRPAPEFGPGPPRLERNARKYRITLANGATNDFITSDPGRLLLTGQIADLNMMDVPNLRGIGRTAPYFHNNSAATLEEMLDHYDAFFKNVARTVPPPGLPAVLSSNGTDLDRGFVLPEERDALIAYLRKL
jgi:cytochrome c peroxidase